MISEFLFPSSVKNMYRLKTVPMNFTQLTMIERLFFPVIFSNADFSVSDTAKGIKFVIGSINWTMCRPGIDNYGQSVEKMVAAIRKKGKTIIIIIMITHIH